MNIQDIEDHSKLMSAAVVELHAMRRIIEQNALLTAGLAQLLAMQSGPGVSAHTSLILQAGRAAVDVIEMASAHADKTLDVIRKHEQGD